jgi:hypothetical protein
MPLHPARTVLAMSGIYSTLRRPHFAQTNQKRSKDEMYRHLSVDVGEDSEHDPWTVERSLQQFFQPEKRELKCEKCESGETATQTLEIISWSVMISGNSSHFLRCSSSSFFTIYKVPKYSFFTSRDSSSHKN